MLATFSSAASLALRSVVSCSSSGKLAGSSVSRGFGVGVRWGVFVREEGGEVLTCVRVPQREPFRAEIKFVRRDWARKEEVSDVGIEFAEEGDPVL